MTRDELLLKLAEAETRHAAWLADLPAKIGAATDAAEYHEQKMLEAKRLRHSLINVDDIGREVSRLRGELAKLTPPEIATALDNLHRMRLNIQDVEVTFENRPAILERRKLIDRASENLASLQFKFTENLETEIAKIMGTVPTASLNFGATNYFTSPQ